MTRGMKAALVVICALLWLPTSALAAPPDNDDFADREALTQSLPIEVTRSNVEATKEEGEWIPGLAAAGHSIWFEWEAPQTEFVTIGTCDTAFPTIVGVFTGTALDGLTPVVGGNADEGPNCPQSQAQYTFKATAGINYVIAADGNSFTGPEPVPVQTEGEIVLRIASTPTPANDDFADATIVNGQTSEEPDGTRTHFAHIRGYNWKASIEPGEPDGDVSGASVWYRWTAPESGTYRVGMPCCGSGLSRTAYTGSSLGSLTPLDLGTGIPGIPLDAGTTLWIRVAGSQSSPAEDPETASFHLFVFGELPPLPPEPQRPVVPPPLPPTPSSPPQTEIVQRTLEHRIGLAKFRFKSTVPGSSFQCKLDKSRFRPCDSPKTYRRLKPGRHVFRVKAVAPSGAVDPTASVGRFVIAAPQRPQQRR